MSQILGIKLSDHGPVCYFASGSLVVNTGQAVLVETDQGVALGRVVTVHVPEEGGSSQPAPTDIAPVETAAPAKSSVPTPFAETFEDGFGEAHWAPFSAPAPQPGPTQPAPSADGQPGTTVEADGHHRPATVDLTQPQVRPKSAVNLSRILRLAVDEDLEIAAENRALARKAHNYCRGCINEQRLDMKLVDVEVLQDKGKMIFYFTAPGRIDFRELIKSLVREFHTRIELRQIGVRHETQMLGAIGNCGQVCCCRRFLRKFAPVTIKMAKEQNLFLNPAKISGICGRLLCCLSYEQKGYEEFHKQCPKIGKRFQTAEGNLKVLRANFFKKSISVWMEEGGEREFTLDEWRELMDRQPGDVPPVDPQAAPKPAGDRQGRDGGRPRTEQRPRTERPRTERPRPDKPRSERTRAENARVESARVESARADSARSENMTPDNGRPENIREGGAEKNAAAQAPLGADTASRPPRDPRAPRPPRDFRPENRSEKRVENAPGVATETAASERPATGEQPAGVQGEGEIRQRPRRKRRRPKGPKTAG